MKLNLISWNIRHLRWDKVTTYLDAMIAQLDAGHVMFFYENKNSNEMGKEFRETIGEEIGSSGGAGSQRIKWKSYKYYVGTNEYVWIVYSKLCETGINSKQGPGKTFWVRVEARHEYDTLLRQNGEQALRQSHNVTVLSELSMGRANFRIPAVVDIILTRPDSTEKTVRVAAWHAPGPAKGTAPILNAAYQATFGNQVDLFLGDFNLTGLDSTGQPLAINASSLTLQRTNQSTTITATGPVGHAEGLDLVYQNTTRIASGLGAANLALGRSQASVVPKPASITQQEAFDLSDHRPVLVTIKGL